MWNPNISFRRGCSAPWYHKRKVDPDPGELELPPPKMLITEEKMVNQLKGIHLSQDYTTHGTAAGPSSADMEESLGEKSLPTLVMCEEIRELRGMIESPLPKHLLDNMKRPTNALVLWRPPAGELGHYLKSLCESQQPEEQPQADVDMDDDDNNNQSSPNQPFTRTV